MALVALDTPETKIPTQVPAATHQGRFFDLDDPNPVDFRPAWDILENNMRIIDELETDRLLGRLTEQQELEISALVYDKHRYFLKTAAEAVSRLIDKHQEARQGGGYLALGALALRVDIGCLSLEDGDQKILYGDPILTDGHIAQGYRLATDEEWVELFLNASIAETSANTQ